MPNFSFGGQEIIQQPGSVMMLSGTAFRVIPTDGRPPISQDVKMWFGTSRGRWEGDTLVVEVTSLNGLGWLDSTGQYFTENTRMTERWKMVDANTIDYEVTVEDPTVYTRPWKMNFPKTACRDRPETARRPAAQRGDDRRACAQGPVCRRGVGSCVLRGEQTGPGGHPRAWLQVLQGGDASEVMSARSRTSIVNDTAGRDSRAGGVVS